MILFFRTPQQSVIAVESDHLIREKLKSCLGCLAKQNLKVKKTLRATSLVLAVR